MPPPPPLSSFPHLLGAVELRNALAAKFGLELPPTITLDYPSIAALSVYLATAIATSALAPAASQAPGGGADTDSDAEPGALLGELSASDWGSGDSWTSSWALAELTPPQPVVTVIAVSATLPQTGSTLVAVPEDSPSGEPS